MTNTLLTDSQQSQDRFARQVAARLAVDASREEFTDMLLGWAEIAHRDTKWARLELLRHSGLLRPISESGQADQEPPRAA